jgi:hypothetical protein
LFTVGIVIWFFWVRDFPVNSSAPAVLFAAAGIVFYASVACIVMWFWRTLKLHDRYERLCWQRLADSRVSVTTLPDAAYVSRWRDLDAHAALFLIVAFPAMLLPGIAAWRFLQFGPGQFAGLPVPLWILIVAGIMHGWGLWLLTTMLHRHLQAETA